MTPSKAPGAEAMASGVGCAAQGSEASTPEASGGREGSAEGRAHERPGLRRQASRPRGERPLPRPPCTLEKDHRALFQFTNGFLIDFFVSKKQYSGQLLPVTSFCFFFSEFFQTLPAKHHSPNDPNNDPLPRSAHRVLKMLLWPLGKVSTMKFILPLQKPLFRSL